MLELGWIRIRVDYSLTRLKPAGEVGAPRLRISFRIRVRVRVRVRVRSGSGSG